jgi:hypothetical protein
VLAHTAQLPCVGISPAARLLEYARASFETTLSPLTKAVNWIVYKSPEVVDSPQRTRYV